MQSILLVLAAILGGSIAGVVAVVAFLGSLNDAWELTCRPFRWLSARRTRRLLERRLNNPDFDDTAIDWATRYYIRPACTNVDPAGEADWRQLLVTGRQPVFPLMDEFLDKESSKRHLLLLAESGLGKTSFLLNYFAYNLRRRRRHHRIALVYLGHRDALRQLDGLPDPGRTVLFLDSLDEDPAARLDYRTRIGEIMEASQRFRRVVMTCRTQFFASEDEIPRETGIADVGPRAAGRPASFRFWKVYLAPFGTQEAQRYLRHRYPFWARSKRKRATELAEKLGDLAMRPMLLAHVPDLVETHRDLETSADLYEEMVRAWIAREAPRVNAAALREFSERFAVDLHVNLQNRGCEKVHISTLRPMALEWGIDLDRWTLTSRSLLNRDGLGNYKFAHRSISEYLFVKRALKRDPECHGQPLTDQMKEFLADLTVHGDSLDFKLHARLREVRCDVLTRSDRGSVLGWVQSAHGELDAVSLQAIDDLLATTWLAKATDLGLLAHVHFLVGDTTASEPGHAASGVRPRQEFALVYWGLRVARREVTGRERTESGFPCIVFIGGRTSLSPTRIGVLVGERIIREKRIWDGDIRAARPRECLQVRRHLSAFHDGELPIKDQIKVEAHLRICRDCADEALVLERLGTLLRGGTGSDDSAGESVPERHWTSIALALQNASFPEPTRLVSDVQ